MNRIKANLLVFLYAFGFYSGLKGLNLCIKDPVINFHSIIFKAIDQILQPKSFKPRLSELEKRLFIEKLNDEKKAKSAFFYSFMLSFFRYGTISIIQRAITGRELQALAQGLCEFLLGQGFSDPEIPKALLNKLSCSQNMIKNQQEILAEKLFEEFFQIHHYAMAWQEFSQGLTKDPQIRAQETINQPLLKEQLEEELEMINFEIKCEELLYQKDKIETLRTQEQKVQKLEELGLQGKILEFEQQKDKFEHERAIKTLELQRQRDEISIKTSREKLELNHSEKLLELERKKKELEVKAQDIGFFEKTINKFSECLTALSTAKQISFSGPKQ